MISKTIKKSYFRNNNFMVYHTMHTSERGHMGDQPSSHETISNIIKKIATKKNTYK